MLLADPSSLPLDILTTLSIQDTFHLVKEQSLEIGTILAQKIEDPQVLEKMQAAYQNFIKSGQLWALIIGFILGYIFRSFTS